MRARVAALRTTHERFQEICAQYGVETLLAAQEGIIEYVERVVRSRLREIPDGSWYAMHYHDHDGTTNAMYPICCRVVKEGERLVIDLTGTAPQSPGSINCARPAMEGAVFGVILTFLCYDLPWAIAGLRNVVEIVSEEGTWNNALSPAAISYGSTMGTISTHDVVAQAFAKMMLASERYRVEAQANWTPGCNGSLLIAPNPTEEPSVGGVTDFFSGGGGARTFADGVDSGGIFHSMASQIANAETVESRVPVLQVYRRERADSGGPGRFRGGVAVEFATTPAQDADRARRPEHDRLGYQPPDRPRAVRRPSGGRVAQRDLPRLRHPAALRAGQRPAVERRDPGAGGRCPGGQVVHDDRRERPPRWDPAGRWRVRRPDSARPGARRRGRCQGARLGGRRPLGLRRRGRGRAARREGDGDAARGHPRGPARGSPGAGVDDRRRDARGRDGPAPGVGYGRGGRGGRRTVAPVHALPLPVRRLRRRPQAGGAACASCR